MSGREWRPGPIAGSTSTGDEEIGADVYTARSGNSYHVQAHFRLRVMAEGPIPSVGEAQRLAEEWLDRRAKADVGGEA